MKSLESLRGASKSWLNPAGSEASQTIFKNP